MITLLPADLLCGGRPRDVRLLCHVWQVYSRLAGMVVRCHDSGMALLSVCLTVFGVPPDRAGTQGKGCFILYRPHDTAVRGRGKAPCSGPV